jgi:hypothetical protein
VALCSLKQLAIYADGVGFRISFAAEFGNNIPVYAHQSGLDEFFCFAAGRDTGCRHDLL